MTIPFNIHEIYQSILSEFTKDQADDVLLNTMMMDMISIDPAFAAYITEISLIQAKFPISNSDVVISRNCFMAYFSYKVARIKMMNSLEPSNN